MRKFKYLNDKDPWMLAEDIPDINFFFCQIWLKAFANNLENSCGKNYKKVLAIFRGTNMDFYYGEKDSKKFEEHLVNKIFNNSQFGESINKNIYKHSDSLKKFSKKLSQINLDKISNHKIIKLFKEQNEIHTRLYEWGWLSNATDMFHNTFTARLKNCLKKFTKNTEKLNQYLMILSCPSKKSILNKLDGDFLKIISKIQKNHPKIKEVFLKNLKTVELKALKKYWRENQHIKFLWVGRNGTYSLEGYINQINEFLKNGLNAKKVIEQTNKDFIRKNKERIKLIEKINLDKKLQRTFSIYSEFMLTKAYRREAQIYWSYQMNKLLKEAAKRLNISLEQAYFLFPKELEEALTKNIIDKNILIEREKFCTYYLEKGADKIYIGEEAKKFEKLINKSLKNKEIITEIKGQTGCPGKIKGIVKIINSPAEMLKMENGNILVSIATNPDVVPAMKKAAAIITEQGGITCHAAIVSRELNIPCVIGTKIATKVLKDGDLVEVDANKGIVRKLN